MKPHKFLLLAAAAAVVAERAEPTAHFILLATQRTGSTWVMSELSKHSSCIRRDAVDETRRPRRWEMLRQLKNVKNAYSELGHLRDKARAAGLETRMVTYEDLAANATAFAQLANWLQGGGSKCPSAALDSSREVDGPGARAVLKIH